MSHSSRSDAPNTPTSSSVPTLCSCGFYGSPKFNNMCSQCYRDATKSAGGNDTMTVDKKELQQAVALVSSASSTQPAAAAAAIVPATSEIDIPQTPTRKVAWAAEASPKSQPSSSPAPSSSSSSSSSSPFKDRCCHPNCRAVVRRTHKMITKCQCGAFYCLMHKSSTVTHDCEFNRERGRAILVHNNQATISSIPSGGRSFNRID